MTAQEFIGKLERALRGAGVSEYEITDHVNYYTSYFNEQISIGRSEAEVAEELGDPRLIAKTIDIVQDEDDDERYSGSYDHESGTYEEEYQNTAGNQKGFHAQFGNSGWDVRFGRFKINSWYGYLLIALIIFIVFRVLGSIVAFIAPVLFPVLVIMLVWNLIIKRK